MKQRRRNYDGYPTNDYPEPYRFHVVYFLVRTVVVALIPLQTTLYA